MRNIIVFIAFVFGSLNLLAQIDTSYSFEEKKQDYSFETGVSFTKFGKGSSGFTKYISPMTNYSVNENLDITFGANIAQSDLNFRNKTSDDNSSLKGFNLNSNRLFSDANLKLSPKVSIGGSVFYEYNMLQPIGEDVESTDFDSKGLQLNMNYFMNENTSFSLSVGVTEGINYYDPMYHNNNFFNNNSFFDSGFGHTSSPFVHRRNIFE